MVKGSCWPVLSILAMVALMLKYSAWNSRWIRIRGWPTAGARRWGLCWFLSCEFSDSDTGRSAIMRSKAGVPSGCSRRFSVLLSFRFLSSSVVSSRSWNVAACSSGSIRGDDGDGVVFVVENGWFAHRCVAPL